MKTAFSTLGLIVLLTCCTPFAFATDPGVFDITIQSGEDYSLALTVTTCADDPLPAKSADCQVWTPVDITGNTYKAQGRKNSSDPLPFVNFSTSVTNPSAGQLSMMVSHTKTTPLVNVSGLYDLKQTTPAGAVSYLIKGVIKILATVTR